MKFCAYVTSVLLALAASTSSFSADLSANKTKNVKANIEDSWIALDVYKDGKLDHATWVKSGRSSKDFKRADKNKDGVVDKEEFKVAWIFCC